MLYLSLGKKILISIVYHYEGLSGFKNFLTYLLQLDQKRIKIRWTKLIYV